MIGLVAGLVCAPGLLAAEERPPVAGPAWAVPLGDGELAGITGRGVGPLSGIEAGRVILWDERPPRAQAAMPSSGGPGGQQSSTLTVNGR